jgi:hypothetical protein
MLQVHIKAHAVAYNLLQVVHMEDYNGVVLQLQLAGPSAGTS